MDSLGRVGIDIGGTFTDIVFVNASGTTVVKVLSTPQDFSQGVIDGYEATMAGKPTAEEVIHASTVATNAIIERSGAKTALVTTAGFRDVLEIGRVRIPRLYDLRWSKPEPLVRRRHRFEVEERLDSRGNEVRPLDERSLALIVDHLRSSGVESVAVSLLNAYANPEHEERVAARIRAALPEVEVTVATQLLREVKEYERTSTAVINAYIKPVVRRYLHRLQEHWASTGAVARFFMMRSDGTLSSPDSASEQPCFIVESGPAAGVLGAQALTARLGMDNVITFDMGGTTAKAATIEHGQIRLTDEYEVGGPQSVTSRLMKGEGYLLRVPAVDLAEVGAGGGSIAWVDEGGALRVGPRSAGASPGPVCYGNGGVEPTTTDANVVLGYINPGSIAGGTVRIDREAAEHAIREKIAALLDISVEEAAYGIVQVANATMTRAIHAVTTERGRDPADYAMFAFGGGGPLHAGALAKALNVNTITIPLHPGVFSAVGLLFGQVGHHFVKSVLVPLETWTDERLAEAFLDLEQDAFSQLVRMGYSITRDQVAFSRMADVRYLGQSFSLTVPADPGADGALSTVSLMRRFEDEHERTYGYRGVGDPIGLVSLRAHASVELTGRSTAQPLMTLPDPSAARADKKKRRAYFGRGHGWLTTPLIDRKDLPRTGPAIIDEYDSTIVVPVGAYADRDASGNVVVRLEGGATNGNLR